MKLLPTERLLRAFMEGVSTPVADVIVQLAELRELSHADVVRLERWTMAKAPAAGTRLELRLDDEVLARGTYLEVAGHRAMRITEVAKG